MTQEEYESISNLIKSEVEMKVKQEVRKHYASGIAELRESIKELKELFSDECDIPKQIDLAEQLPSVTPTRKKGKWVTKFHGFPPEPHTTCSNCDYDIDFEISKLVKADAFTIKPYRHKFCPNCGAEMESE